MAYFQYSFFVFSFLVAHRVETIKSTYTNTYAKIRHMYLFSV